MMGWKKGQSIRLVPITEASGRVLEVYRDMQQVLGVPHISTFFQYLGSNPRFLDRFWRSVRPLVQSEAFFSCSTQLRADAYGCIRTNFTVPNLKCEIDRQRFSSLACEELKDCINFFCYSIPMSLLLATLLSESFAGPAANANVPRIPAVPPKPRRRIILVDEDSSGPAVKAIFNDIRQTTGADVVHTVYRAFARWPDFLQGYWNAVKPMIASEHFQNCENLVHADSIKLTAELPGPVEFTAIDLAELGMTDIEAGSLTRITEMFVHSLSAALLNVSLARIAMEGGSSDQNAAVDEDEAKADIPTTQPS